MPVDLNLNLGETASNLLAIVIFLLLLYLIGRFVLSGISQALGRAGWIIVILLTVTGVVSMEMWLGALRSLVVAAHATVIDLASSVGIGSGN